MNTQIYSTQQAVLNHLNSLDDNELVNFHNIYCQNQNNGDDEIYTNDEEFFNIFFEGKVLEAVRAVSFGEYNYSHDYVKFNGYGNLISFNSPSDEIDLNEIANEILENPQDFDIDLMECFEINGRYYEGEEDEATEEWEAYKEEIEEENEEIENEEEKTEILCFTDWVESNKKEIE
jgi:hypothetical protein